MLRMRDPAYLKQRRSNRSSMATVYCTVLSSAARALIAFPKNAVGSHKATGLQMGAASWQGAVKIRLYEHDGIDHAVVELIPWRGVSRVLYDRPVAGGGICHGDASGLSAKMPPAPIAAPGINPVSTARGRWRNGLELGENFDNKFNW